MISQFVIFRHTSVAEQSMLTLHVIHVTRNCKDASKMLLLAITAPADPEPLTADLLCGAVIYTHMTHQFAED